MDLRSLLQDILSEVSPKRINFQIELHLLITWVRSSDYFRFIESLRTCIMASHYKVRKNSKNPCNTMCYTLVQYNFQLFAKLARDHENRKTFKLLFSIALFSMQ